MYPGYKIIAEDSLHHEKYIIQVNETVTIERKVKFTVNITYQNDACFSGYTYNQLYSEYDHYVEYTKQKIPSNCRPYYAKFENSEPNKYKFYYTIDYEDNSVLHDLTNETIYSGYYFSLTLYVTSSNGKCNKQVLEDEFRGDHITYDIVNYIPKKCQNVLYKVIVSFNNYNRPDDCIIKYTTSLNSTMITANGTINISSEENFKLNLFMSYKYCSNYYIYSYQADPFAKTREYDFYNLPDVCEKENQIYQALINISDLPPEYSIEYQTLNYTNYEYGLSTKANELINITKNEVFGVKVVLASSPGCSNSFLFEIKVDDVLPIENITINDIPLKCRMEGTVTDSIRENDIFDIRFEYEPKSTSDEIREEIKSLFNDKLLWENDPNKDKVIVIQGVDYNPLKFNMDLEDNEYISIKKYEEINYENGNLNLFLDSDYVTINVPEKVNLKVKGGGTLTFESEYKEINVSSQFIINKDLKLRSYKIERLNFDSIDIYENVVMTNERYGKINIKNVNVKPGANVSMNGINTIENLAINQPGRLIKDGSFENSSIVFNLKSNIDIIPMLQGSLTKSPKSISIKNDASEPEINQEITLISSEYSSDFRCNDWKEALDLEGSGYNYKECITKSDSRFLSSSIDLIIRKIKKDDDGGKGNNKNGLEPGVIAAIVIVVVVVVAAIIVVVVIVIRKKKNRENSESQAEGNAEDI